MFLLNEIKRIMYTGGSNNLLAKHNKAKAHIRFMSLQKEKYQDIQEFRDQYIALRKVCTELGIRFRQSKDDVKAIIKSEGIDNTTSEQIKEAIDRAEEEHHAVLFLYKADRHKYVKLI